MISKEKQITTKEQLREWLAYEKDRYGSISRLNCLLQVGEMGILWKHQTLLRKAEYYHNTHKKLRAKFYLFRLLRMQNRYALHIPLNCCGKGFKIMHIGPILINGNASVGENCSFHINTALTAGGTNDCAPQLGDRIVLGIGAVVLGNTQIADGVAVGANAVVNKSVLEPNIAVAGVPAKKVSNNGTAAWNKNASSAEKD